jgi:hypothetical protein
MWNLCALRHGLYLSNLVQYIAVSTSYSKTVFSNRNLRTLHAVVKSIQFEIVLEYQSYGNIFSQKHVYVIYLYVMHKYQILYDDTALRNPVGSSSASCKVGAWKSMNKIR